jgi:hypothetical protein
MSFVGLREQMQEAAEWGWRLLGNRRPKRRDSASRSLTPVGRLPVCNELQIAVSR